jgi:serine/threonine-protein kinase HipA
MATRRLNALDLWMNGQYVGRWERGQRAHDRLVYAASWVSAAEGRPLSLSLPFAQGVSTGQDISLSGLHIAAWFENLIPDNEAILLRLQQRFGASSTTAFDLLAAIGRDCAGALQIVPAGAAPVDPQRIDADALDEVGVARVLRETTMTRGLGARQDDAFRLSIAGAQEKTALLRHQGRWCQPRGSTPSSHIFKLPLGRVGNQATDLSLSVELEWLSLRLAAAYGLPVANAEMGRFEEQTVLIVERFDRRLHPSGDFWLRLPQEDLCQALGVPPARKYETDGGPGIGQVMDLLRGSARAAQDRLAFFTAQLVFWLLAATDGHGKNFSLALLPGGRYQLAPLYDILSAWPIHGAGSNQLSLHELRQAMAVSGRNRHYHWSEIHRWHWVRMGERLGLGAEVPRLIQNLLERTAGVLETVAKSLPADFPTAVFQRVADGVQRAARRLADEPDERKSQ